MKHHTTSPFCDIAYDPEIETAQTGIPYCHYGHMLSEITIQVLLFAGIVFSNIIFSDLLI